MVAPVHERARRPGLGNQDRARTRLLGLGTALPPHRATQAEIGRFTAEVVRASAPAAQRQATLAFVERIYSHSGIGTRHSVIPDYQMLDPAGFVFYPKRWDLEPFPGTAARMRAYEELSVDLAGQAATRALASAGIDARAVTHLIVSTCTGFFAPGPDILLARQLGLRSEISRTIIGFMGCYAGFNGMRLADQITTADPRALVLQVAVELCSLHYQKRLEPELMVANSLFADGSAAAVYGTAESGLTGDIELVATRSDLCRDTLDPMGWRIGDHGFEMRLDASVPRELGNHIEAFVCRLIEAGGVERSEIRNWVVHPGGRKILDELASALDLGPADLDDSYQVLAECGNVSSATIFFVLERALGRGRPGPTVALGFGPGLTLEGALFHFLP